MKKLWINLFIFVTFLFVQKVSANNFVVYQKQIGNTFLPFVKNSQKSEQLYSEKPDLDYIEAAAPLKPEMLKDIKPQDLRELSSEEFMQLFARLGSGPMPKGEFGGFILQKPSAFSALKKRVMKKVMGSAELNRVITKICGREVEDCFIELLWSGKSFSEKNELDQVRASTVINPLTAGVKVASDNQSWLKKNWLGAAVGGIQNILSQWTAGIFPMNAYCGISQVDTRRESIITDGAFGDDFGFPYFIEARDQIVTRKGLNITEEYRMVRPGLYIGRVYLNKIYLFNVAIEQMGQKAQLDTENACEDSIKML